MSVSSPSSGAARALAALELLVGLPVAVGLALGTGSVLSLPPAFAGQVTALYAAVCVGILWKAPALAGQRGRPGLGAANRVTLGRLLVALPAAALVLYPQALDPGGRWLVVGLGTLVLSLDGLDGWVARRTGTESAFGARFDMETDAAFLLVLALLVWRTGQGPVWVLLVGAMRYLFVAAGRAVPALRGPLPPSLRRKVVCVVQGVALLVAVGPVLPPLPATAVVGGALVLLTWSFAVDTAWLIRHRSGSPAPHVRTA